MKINTLEFTRHNGGYFSKNKATLISRPSYKIIQYTRKQVPVFRNQRVSPNILNYAEVYRAPKLGGAYNLALIHF